MALGRICRRADAPTPPPSACPEEPPCRTRRRGERRGAAPSKRPAHDSPPRREATQPRRRRPNATAREAWRAAQTALAEAREELAAAERATGQFASRRAALEDALSASRQRHRRTTDAAIAERRNPRSPACPISPSSTANWSGCAPSSPRTAAPTGRSARRGRRLGPRDRRTRHAASRQSTAKPANWRERGDNARSPDRDAAPSAWRNARDELGELSPTAAPDRIPPRRARRARSRPPSERRQAAADRLAEAENELADADKAARQALAALSAGARGARPRRGAPRRAAQERRAEIEHRIREELDCEPPSGACTRRAQAPTQPLPEIAATSSAISTGYKAERERLGAVNLRAEEEATEIAERRDALIAERDDLIEAIRRLRQGIHNLNREGRERLLAAFDVVNAHFQRLFTHLFGGGTAELQLIESDDPLEAGLEILARPPGKKPQTMTLLSGGEQALTAMALIFAVFLTNPAPICVLDEVDAPLDDHNVERFCNLMDEMAATTDTRFVIITHNPITMARMNRLFGVTMAERGVSQLVCVDLEEAEKLREAV